MNMFKEMRRRIAQWLDPPRHKRRTPRTHQYVSKWTAEGSKTEGDILALFTDDDIEMTQRDISACLNVKTAAMVLPRLVERGKLLIVDKTRPYRYRRTGIIFSHQQTGHCEACGHQQAVGAGNVAMPSSIAEQMWRCQKCGGQIVASIIFSSQSR
jgi:hypothetical protein